MAAFGGPPLDDEIERRRVIAEAEERLFGTSGERVRIGRFEVRGRLGMGGLGVVYAAWDPELEREVALKLLRQDRSEGNARDRERIVLEARAMARLAHPHVVPVYEVGVHDGRVFLAMERVAGQTLRAWLEQTRPGWREVLFALIRAGEGIAAAHAAGIVHRDLKPENILIGADGRPRVTDFGIAHEPAAQAGTLAYMAPEQRAGSPVGPAADQYAFCVTLYEALHGQRPPAPPIAAVPHRISRALARGLAARPEDRFSSMDALLRALLEQPQRRLLRWAGLGLVALVLLAALAGAVLQMWMFNDWMRAARKPKPAVIAP